MKLIDAAWMLKAIVWLCIFSYIIIMAILHPGEGTQPPGRPWG